MPQLTGEPAGRIAPAAELVNTLEFEAMAKRKLDAAASAELADDGRKRFDRITFRPRVMVNTTALDLTAHLLGQDLFAPIIVAPVARQKRFHPEGELATAKGASAARTLMIVADDLSVPVDEIAKQKSAFWYQVNAEGDVDAARSRAIHAVECGARALCLTVNGWDWSAIDRFRSGLKVPLVLKGIMSPDDASAAVKYGVNGIVVSNYGGVPSGALAQPIEVLPRIADAVAGKAGILVDGGFRRGAHILMALALGAQAVLIGRPVMWGLGAYGAEGVERVLGLLQNELARDMAMCGRPNIRSIDRTVVQIRRW